MTLKEAVAAKQEAMLCALQESIRIKSVEEAPKEGAPYGEGVKKCLTHALKTGESLGLFVGEMDSQVGWCEYGDGEEMIAVLGHLDVVPEGEGWSVAPYGAQIKDGKIFGRGAIDDKGPTIAAIFALAAIRDSGLPIRRKIRVLLGTNEETGSKDMKYYCEHGGEIPVMGFTPDGEYPLINGEKGLLNTEMKISYEQNDVKYNGQSSEENVGQSNGQGDGTNGGQNSGMIKLLAIEGGVAPNVVPDKAFAVVECGEEMAEQLLEMTAEKVSFTKIDGGVLIEAYGISAHGSTPEQGENAIGRLLQVLALLPFSDTLRNVISFLADKIGMETDGSSLGIALCDDISGKLTLNLGTISGDENSFSVRINYRYPVTKKYEDCAPVLKKAFLDVGFEMISESHKPSLYVEKDSELVQTLLRVYREKTGRTEEPKSIGGGTYAKAIPNVVAFGPVFPGDEVREHQPDEFIEIDKLMENMQIIAEAMYQLAK